MEHAAVTAGHIAFERRGALGLVTLTRPDALNAVTHDMVLAMRATLDEWAADDSIATVCIMGEGRAFSAGGDIRAIYERGRAGEPFDQFFADEYALNIQIKRFPKPYVALIDGIAMGGGVGVSYHGSHVVVGEKARFAMPECGIGFFPDVGGTSLLGNLPGDWGPALGLSGARMDAMDQIALGLATHAVREEQWGELLARLADGEDPDAALTPTRRFAERSHGDEPVARRVTTWSSPTFLGGPRGFLPPAQEPEAHRPAMPDGWDRLAKQSPLSFQVATRQIALGRDRSFQSCMGIEARIVHRMLRGHDFYEGIRAAVIDKDSAPRWRPATLDAVTEAEVDAHFEPVRSGPLASISARAD